MFEQILLQVGGNLVMAGLTYITDQLRGKSVVLDEVMNHALPVLQEMAAHKGRLSAKRRIEYQDRLDGIIKAFS